MKNKPDNSEQVYDVMKEYCNTKQYTFTDAYVRYMAEECFLTHESRGWKGCRYWPPLAMRWVLNNKSKQITKSPTKEKPEQGETIRDRLLRENYHV